MLGSTSDSYDLEWGTSDNADQIRDELDKVYNIVSKILGDVPPILITQLVGTNLPELITSTLTEKRWRLIRFALERARESL